MHGMIEPEPVLKEELFRGLPPLWPDATLRQQIHTHNSRAGRCIVALDDDPTGTQTVHDIWVLTRWEVSDLTAALSDGETALYILTNSRSMPLADAQQVNREIAANLVQASLKARRQITVVSRSDSTLRGHFPGEVDALEQALSQAQKAAFDGICIIPFFPEGGRFTIDNIHWVQEDERLIPAAQTPYARDSVFGYQHSRLPDWVEEKTGGRVKASQVHTITLETLRRQGPDRVAEQLRAARGGAILVVNAAHDRDLEVFVAGLLQVEGEGMRFLFRTAASFVKVASGLADKPLLSAQELVGARRQGGGLIVFGSHVPKSTAQLAVLRSLEGVVSIELEVAEVLDSSRRQKAVAQATAAANQALGSKKNALLFTSRMLVSGNSQAESLSIGKSVSQAMMEVVHGIEHEPRFVIGKGGITSSDLATEGMGVRAARVLGQVLPGVPVWQLGPGSRWPGVTYIVFPGNVGDESAVARVVSLLVTPSDS
jgi:uncharacterized protein YgbK (DUF1537 family)